MLDVAARHVTPIYAECCACGAPQAEMFVHYAKTDAEAAAVFLEREALYVDGGSRYWIVHGPDGHVVSCQI